MLLYIVVQKQWQVITDLVHGIHMLLPLTTTVRYLTFLIDWLPINMTWSSISDISITTWKAYNPHVFKKTFNWNVYIYRYCHCHKTKWQRVPDFVHVIYINNHCGQTSIYYDTIHVGIDNEYCIIEQLGVHMWLQLRGCTFLYNFEYKTKAAMYKLV